MDNHHHHHDHEHTVHSREEAIALLNYMTEHTRHHNEELHDIAHSLGGEAEELIHSACDSFADGIERLDAALAMLKEKGE